MEISELNKIFHLKAKLFLNIFLLFINKYIFLDKQLYMKLKHSIMPKFATIVFKTASVFAGITFLLLLSSILFSFNPSINIRNKHFGIVGYEKGYIPTNFSSYKSFPDMSIKRTVKDSEFIIDHKSYTYTTTTQLDIPVIKSDTISTVYKDLGKNNLQVSGIIIEKGKLLIKPESLLQRLLLSIPLLLILLLVSFCCWQLSVFISNISKGNSFNLTNFKKLNKIGYTIIISYAGLLLFDTAINSNIRVFLRSSLKDFWTPFEYNFKIDAKLDIVWLVVGVLFIILATAFKSGHKLQQEQDLTV